jgi:hypothetical protein
VRAVSRIAGLATLAAALWLLNAALTFHNVWPTPAIEWRGEWSVELALLVLGLAAWCAWRGPPGRRLIGALAATGVVFVLARYAEVTAPALYGRGINLYWDARHVGGVVAMLVQVAPAWQVLGGLAAVLLVLGAAGWLLGRCVARLARALEPRAAAGFDVATRRVLVAGAAGVLLLFAADRAGALQERGFGFFSVPVTQTWARQFALFGGSWLANRATPAAGAAPPTDVVAIPVLHVPAAAGPRPDVYLVFVESYGAVAWQRPDIAARLVESRTRLAAAIATTGRGVVSAWVRSPTFGSGSWLAHASLLAGTAVRDGDDYARLLLRPRVRLTDAFRADGYRVLALMPGLRQAWPEGDYFHFDDIYGAARLDYHGPEFGWWRIPDQFALAQFDALEAAREPATPPSGLQPPGAAAARAPRFVFFPTISSHMPFRPTPPYQGDWQRLLGPVPFGDEAARAIAQAPEWTRLGPAYGDSLAYAQRTLAGYLERHDGQPLVMLLLGDHQPPAAVSGEGAVHDVPVHVIADRPEVLEALLERGFVPGLDPAGAPIGEMHALGPMLISALGTASRSPVPAIHAARSVGAAQGLAVAPASLPN